MTTKAKKPTTTKMCKTCIHRYEVKCNTPSGLLTLQYCRHRPDKGDYDFDLVKLGDLCSNYKNEEDGSED